MSHKKHQNIRRGGHVRAVRYHDLLRAKRAQNPLTDLNPQRVKHLYELYREGKYADVQLAWDAIEEYDDMLGTVLERRQAALGEMEWDVLIDSRAVGEDAALQQLAAAQQDFIVRRLLQVENLTDAVKWLGLANFRRYAALEVYHRGDVEHWLPIHSWLLCRPSLEGEWMYNENAETSCTRVEAVDMSGIIMREVARPIDLVAMFLISAKEGAIDGWDSFLEVYGNPAMFFKMPPNTSDDQRDEYAAIINEIVGEGRGVYPDGGEIKTIETNAANADAFSNRAEWCDKAIVRRATGGLLTVLAESGSGTLAGSAHMEAFRQLAANDAISIAECINRQYVRRLLATHFPGQPRLAYFKLTPPVINDKAATVNMICQLGAAGYRATDEVVSEEVGMEVHTAEQPAAASSPPAPAGMLMNTADTLPAQSRENNSSTEAPLTESELAAFHALSHPNPQRMEQYRTEVETALRQAADLDTKNLVNSEDITDLLKDAEEDAENKDGLITNSSLNPCRAKNPVKCPYHGGFEHPLTGKTGTAASLGLPSFDGDEVKGEPSLKRISSKLSESLMRGGIEVKSVDGESVTFDGEVPDHWLGLDGSEKKSKKQRDKRLGRLADALRAVVHPHEVWLHHGRKVYVRKYATPKGDGFTMAGVIKENGKARTYYWDRPSEMEHVRQGKLLYCRTK